MAFKDAEHFKLLWIDMFVEFMIKLESRTKNPRYYGNFDYLKIIIMLSFNGVMHYEENNIWSWWNPK